MLGDARKTSTKSLCQAPNADLECNKYPPSGGVFIVVKYRLPKSAASGEEAGSGLKPWLAAGAFLRRSRACPGRQCVQRSAPARDSSSCSLSGAGVWDQRCAAGARGSGIFWQGWRVVRGIGRSQGQGTIRER